MRKPKLNLLPDKQSSLVTFLLDRSGSMESIKSATIEGFNAYLGGLKAEKDADIFFTFVQFDSYTGVDLEKICVAVPIKDAPLLGNHNFRPRGGTPLIDAAYITITSTMEAVALRKDNPKVVICIQTDGYENQSQFHNWADLKRLISAQQEKGWEFNFMGAGIDAYQQARMMGISAGQTMSYDSANIGATRDAFASTAHNTVEYATGNAISTVYTAVQKKQAGDKFDPAASA